MNHAALKMALAVIASFAADAAFAQGAPSPMQRGVGSPFGTPQQQQQQPTQPAQEWRSVERAVAPAAKAASPGTARPVARMAGRPQIRLAPARPAYALAPACEAGKPVATVRIVATNTGSVSVPPSAPAVNVLALDETPLAWAGSARLPALAAGASATVSIPLMPPSRPDAVSGQHRFRIISEPLYAETASPVDVAIPAGFCARLVVRDPKRTILSRSPVPAAVSAQDHARLVQTAKSNSGLAARLRATLPVPSGLGSTVDKRVCGLHGGYVGESTCDKVLIQGKLALIWKPLGRAVDGYKVYRVDGGRQNPVGQVTGGKDNTLYIVDPVPADGYAHKCYAVAAFRGAEESAMSEPKCPARGDYIVMQNVVLTPLHVRTVFRYHSHPQGILGPYDSFYDDGGISAGYSYQTEKSFFGDGYHNSIKHAGLHFDTSAFEHWTIRSAVLKLRVDLSNVGTDRHEDHTTSCVTRVEEAREYWWDHPNAKAMIQTVPGAENRGVQNGPDLVLDVTSIVRGWAQFPDRNFGLVLGNDKTGVDVFLDEACLTQYVPTSARLEVDFY